MAVDCRSLMAHGESGALELETVGTVWTAQRVLAAGRE